MMFPVRVDFPESTCPMKIRLADSRWKVSRLAYLLGSQVLAFNSAAVIVGSSFLITSSYFGFYYFGLGLGCSIFLLAYFFFFFYNLKWPLAFLSR